MSYLTEHCPGCGVKQNNHNRLILDSCGHRKCRNCFLDDEAECLQCSWDKEPESQGPTHSRRQQGTPSRAQRPTPARTSAATRLSDDDSGSLPKHIRQIVMSERLVQYHCNVCRKSFSRSQQYYHMACAGDESAKRFKCGICNKAYISRSHLNYHMESHTGIIYHCKECNKSFTNRAVLNKHEKQHIQLPFRCTECGRDFKFKASLTAHMDMHLNGPGYPCTICDKRYTQKSSLTQHMAVHDENKFECIHCGKRFQRNYSLTLHLKKHSDLESFVCTICYQSFSDLNNLMRHAKIHGEEIKYKCTHCEITSLRKDNILRHVKNVHSGEDIQTCVEIVRTSPNQQTEPSTEPTPEPAEENNHDYGPADTTGENIPMEVVEEYIPLEAAEERPSTSTAYLSIEDLLKRKPIYEYRLNEEPSQYLAAQQTLPQDTNQGNSEYRYSLGANGYRSSTAFDGYRSLPTTNAYLSSPAINEYPSSSANNEYRSSLAISEYKSTPGIHEYRSSPVLNAFGSSQGMHQYTSSPIKSDYRSTAGTSGYRPSDGSNNNMSMRSTYTHLPSVAPAYEVAANEGATYDLLPTQATYVQRVKDGQYQYIPSLGAYIVYLPASRPTFDYIPNEDLNVTADFSVDIHTPQTVENSVVIKSIGNPPTPVKVEAAPAHDTTSSSNLSILEPTHKNYYGNKRHKKFKKKYDPIELYRKILTSDEEAGEDRAQVTPVAVLSPSQRAEQESTGRPLRSTFNLSSFSDMHWRKNVKYTYEYQEY